MHLLLDRPRIPTPTSSLTGRLLAPLVIFLFAAAPALAQGTAPKAFVEDFDKLDLGRWYVSDGWNNGKFQNCTWSKDDVKAANGILSITFNKRTLKDRDYSCGELQTKARYGYGVYEARLRSPAASGVNAAFF